MADQPLAAILGSFAADFTLDSSPQSEWLMQRAQLHLLDMVGLALAGWSADDQIGDVLQAATAEPGRSSVIGKSTSNSAAAAALINGTLATAWTFDDADPTTAMHCEACIGAATLAVAEEIGCGGDDLITGFVVGTEVALRLAAAVPGTRGLYDSGFHATSVFGTLGAAAGAARILGLDASQCARALAVAVSFASGTAAGWTDGSGRNKTIHPGWAAHCGVVAARLAAAGFSCSLSTLDGDRGLFHGVAWASGWEAQPIIHELGRSWRLANLEIKRHPSGSSTQPMIRCFTQLYNESGVRAADVVSGVITLPPSYSDILADVGPNLHRPSTGSASIGSFPLIAARILDEGVYTLAHRTDAAVHESRILELADKFVVRAGTHALNDDPDRHSTLVDVELNDGRREHLDSSDAGIDDDELSSVTRKFDANAGLLLDTARVNDLREVLLELNTLPTVRDLQPLLQGLRRER
jgi:2-methylcitrate dehydratase PrpD